MQATVPGYVRLFFFELREELGRVFSELLEKEVDGSGEILDVLYRKVEFVAKGDGEAFFLVGLLVVVLADSVANVAVHVEGAELDSENRFRVEDLRRGFGVVRGLFDDGADFEEMGVVPGSVRIGLFGEGDAGKILGLEVLSGHRAKKMGIGADTEKDRTHKSVQ